MSDEQVCSKCGESKPRTPEFFLITHSHGKKLLRCACRVCTNALAKARIEAKGEDYVAGRRLFTSRYTAQHPEKRREWDRRFEAAHPDRIRAKRAAYRNEQRVRSWVSACLKRRVPASPEAEAYARGLLQDPCSYCGTNERVGIDHIVPIRHGGLTTPDNLTACCHRCNSKKRQMSLLAFFAMERAR